MKELLESIKYCSLDQLNEIERAIKQEKRKFPKQEKLKILKANDPVIEFRLKCHRLCKCWLDDNGHRDHAWDVLQRKGLNGIIDKIKASMTSSGREVTEETVSCSFQAMMLKLPPFWANKVDFDLFDRRFSAIVSEIKSQKNVRQQINGKTGSNSDVANDALQLLNARIQNRPTS